ncbi:hypothetical protein PMAYCL1PPCAC_25985 [Pristionchus mayeri]|uniref:BTB domain-containing protein n=1 Tax=Pristionchus mayeri TaxID=1317129 RepID=A0AAN5D484_9BILA|nr:hypothetical protein PMAYCL1PPCAC_25985 [Pristionchus mayeri]
MLRLRCYGDFDSLSDATKAAICGRMKELIFECGNCMTHGAPDPTPTPVAQPRMVHSLQTRGAMAGVPNRFSAPTELSNVIIIVEGKKLHVNKDYLATHSPYFSAMFFGEFAEKGKEEVEIKDIVYEEFVDLLNLIHPGFSPIKDTTVSHILKLSDLFQMKGVF